MPKLRLVRRVGQIRVPAIGMQGAGIWAGQKTARRTKVPGVQILLEKIDSDTIEFSISGLADKGDLRCDSYSTTWGFPCLEPIAAKTSATTIGGCCLTTHARLNRKHVSSSSKSDMPQTPPRAANALPNTIATTLLSSGRRRGIFESHSSAASVWNTSAKSGAG